MPGIAIAAATPSASRAIGNGNDAVCVVTACRSFIPANPAPRGSTERARAIAATASGVVMPRFSNVTKRCSPLPFGAYAGISSTTKSSGEALMVAMAGIEGPP